MTHFAFGFIKPLVGAGFPTPAFSWEPETAQTPPASLSFTRATEATVLGTTDGTTNWYQTAQSGEIRYEGLRRVENIITNDALAGFTTATGASISSDEITYPGSANGELVRQVNIPVTATQRICASVKLRLVSGAGTFRFDLRFTGSGVPTTITQEITVTGTEQRFAIFGAGLADDTGLELRLRNSATPAASVVEATEWMVHVAQEGQSLPEDYVALATTHNANVAGVRYFNTTNGNSVDGNGVVTEAAGSAITGGGYLAEPAATNQMPTTDLSAAAWNPTNATQTDDGINELGLRQVTLDAGTGTGVHGIFDSASSSGAGSGYFIVKQGTSQFVNIRRGGSTTDYAVFDLDAGTITEEGAGITSSFMQDQGDGWYICGIVTADTSSTFQLLFATSGTPGTSNESFTGTNETLLLCHAQYETNNFPTSPIVTSGSTVTRNRDVADSDLDISVSPYSVFVDATAPSVKSSFMSLFSATSTRRISANTSSIQGSLTSTSLSITMDVTGRHKYAQRAEDSDCGLAVEDETTANAASGTAQVPVGAFKGIGTNGSITGSEWRGRIHKIQSYSVGLTDEQLETLVA